MGYTWANLGSNPTEIADFYDNYTRCDSWQKIASSHKVADDQLRIKIEHTYGLLILLLAGFCTAAIVIVAEKLISAKANMPRKLRTRTQVHPKAQAKDGPQRIL